MQRRQVCLAPERVQAERVVERAAHVLDRARHELFVVLSGLGFHGDLSLPEGRNVRLDALCDFQELACATLRFRGDDT